MNIISAPARALHQKEPTDLAASRLVGKTPTLWIGDSLRHAGSGRGYWAKLEGNNTGGIKDRAALHMVGRARDRGDLRPRARIVESSSGALGLGLSLAGIVYNHPVTVVTDPGMEPLVVDLLRSQGADVDMVDTPHPVGGWQQARKDRVQQLLAADPEAWCPDGHTNPDNADAFAGLARELIADVGRIDVLVTSVGTGGHPAGIARVLRSRYPDLLVVGVDSTRDTNFGQPTGKRQMRGLGSSMHPGNVDYRTFDEVHWVSPAEAVWACRRLAAISATTGGWSVGAVSLVADWVARTQPQWTRIAAVFPDGKHRYWDTVFSDDYCKLNGLSDVTPANRPDELAHRSGAAAARWSRCATVVDARVAARAAAGWSTLRRSA